MAAVVSPIYGYFTNLFPTRRLLCVALGSAALATCCVLLSPVSVVFVWINYVLTGLAFGTIRYLRFFCCSLCNCCVSYTYFCGFGD